MGSPNGQQIVIAGKGFSSNPSEISVKVDGIDCIVSGASTQYIYCEVQPGNFSNQPFYQGGSGLKYEYFNLNQSYVSAD